MVLTTMLISIVEVSNVFSVLIVFSVFCVMVVFILRLHSEEFRMTSVTFTSRPAVLPLPMIKVCNPFVFSLKTSAGDCQASTINDVACMVSSQASWIIQDLWGVSISDLHPALNAPWTVFREMIMSENFLKDSCLKHGSLQHHAECKDMEVHVSHSNSMNPEDLGTSPRIKYPLVVILMRQDESNQENHEVGAMINIVHIRDNHFKMTSCVMTQYLKLTNGHLTNLKQLYIVSDENPKDETEGKDDTVAESDLELIQGQSEVLCIVCQSGPVTRALLPCRHVCACRKCFAQLDKCPMCRSTISSYFCIQEESLENSDTEQAEQTPVNLRQRLERWNDRLNQLFGLT